MVILLLFVPHPFGAPSRPERVGKLRHRENAFAVEFLTLLFAHAGQQAKVVLFNCLQSAPGLELTLPAVPVQDQLGWRGATEQRGDFLNAPSHFTSQSAGFQFQYGVIVAIDDFAETGRARQDRKSTRLNSSHVAISYAVFCL